jgi:HD-GYP domain-containing protein (c-di-GMP phosphodiesterase class II)
METATLRPMSPYPRPGAECSPVKDLKLSFAKLAATQSKGALRNARSAVAVHSAPTRPQESRNQLYSQACDYLSHVFQMLRSRKAFTLAPALEIIRKMAAPSSAPDELFIAALHIDDRRQFAIAHSVNVAVYAIKMAQDLGFDLERQVQIGTAGLFHDIGMALIPEPIIYKQGPLGAEELKTLKDRPNLAFTILQGLGSEGATLAEAAAQVYERLDGSGYPRGLQADEIHEFSKILGLLDLYEALVHSRPSRVRLSFFEAVKYIFKSCKTQFDRNYMKSLLRVFTVFPVHSYVQLNSEAVGRVIQTYPDQPMRPKLQIIMDSQRRKPLNPQIVNLPESPLLNIVRSISKKEIQDLFHGAAVAHEEPDVNSDTVKEPIM